mgnify:CR=1 FL=1
MWIQSKGYLSAYRVYIFDEIVAIKNQLFSSSLAAGSKMQHSIKLANPPKSQAVIHTKGTVN